MSTTVCSDVRPGESVFVFVAVCSVVACASEIRGDSLLMSRSPVKRSVAPDERGVGASRAVVVLSKASAVFLTIKPV